MKIVVTANGADLDAPASPVFGRCPIYVFVDTETMQFEAVGNPAVAAGGGAGIQAAQFVIEQGAQAVVTGNAGPNGGASAQAGMGMRRGMGRGRGMGRRAQGAVPPPPPPMAPVAPAPSREEETATLKERWPATCANSWLKLWSDLTN